RALAGASIAQYGGRFLVRGGAAELIEGSPAPQRVVLTEFADVAAAKSWYNSPEYQKALPIRLANSKGRAFIVEGACPDRPTAIRPGSRAPARSPSRKRRRCRSARSSAPAAGKSR